jgi:hypothetical protein
MYNSMIMATQHIERRTFLRLTVIAGVGVALISCLPEIIDTTPARTPYPTKTPHPTLVSGEITHIPACIPDVSIFSRPSGFTDASVYLEKDVPGMSVSPIRENDWFEKIAIDYDYVPGVHINPDIYAYFDSKRQKLYTGFGHNGRDDDILGWKICDVSYPKFLTNVSGKFAYVICGEDSNMISREAAVIVDIPNGRKTFITYQHNGMDFEFGFSNNATIFAINEVCSDDRPEKGVYLIDTQSWNVQFIHEHVNIMQISEDGMRIYSQTGPEYSSKIINAATGEITIIDWPLYIGRSRLGVGGGNTDVVSPNIRYVATKIFANNPCMYDSDPNCALYNDRMQSAIKDLHSKMAIWTPDGYIIRDIVTSISDEGVVHYENGMTEQLPK